MTKTRFGNILFSLALLSFSSCSPSLSEPENTKKNELIQYAKLLSVREDTDSFHITVSSPNSPSLLYSVSKSDTTPPYQKMVSLSSVFSGFICELGAQQHIAAVDNIAYLSNADLIKRHKQGTLPSVSLGGKINTERLLSIKPDLVIHSGFGEINQSLKKRLKEFGIAFFLCNNYLEESPLGRAEWIKAFGILCGKKELAFALFDTIAQQYLEQKKQTFEHNPTVLAGTLFGGVWDVPAAKSYTAQLIKDAGGNYLWQNEGNEGRIPLSLESVAAKALQADIWIHTGSFESLQEMKTAEPRYRQFKAFREARVYNNNKQVNEKGGNAFWETAPVRPDVVLQDLIHIFHSDTNNNPDLVYYKKLE